MIIWLDGHETLENVMRLRYLSEAVWWIIYVSCRFDIVLIGLVSWVKVRHPSGVGPRRGVLIFKGEIREDPVINKITNFILFLPKN